MMSYSGEYWLETVLLHLSFTEMDRESRVYDGFFPTNLESEQGKIYDLKLSSENTFFSILQSLLCRSKVRTVGWEENYITRS